MKNRMKQGNSSDLSNRKIEMERRILKSKKEYFLTKNPSIKIHFSPGIIITVTGFIVTWTPYAIVFFISVFRGREGSVDPLATFICACFAKSSIVWIPLLYISTSTHFKFRFVDLVAIQKQEQTTGQHPVPQDFSMTNPNYVPTFQPGTSQID